MTASSAASRRRLSASRAQWETCDCGKVASPTEESARFKAALAQAVTGNENDLDYYQCPAGSWHWSRSRGA